MPSGALKPLVNRVVLDSSAVLAVLFRERGHERVAELSAAGLISAVNLAEVASKMAERGLRPADALSAVEGLNAAVADFDAEQALHVGRLRPETADAGLSLGDRACLALARRTGWTLVTSDSRLAEAGEPRATELIR